jgi:hypothetical protein
VLIGFIFPILFPLFCVPSVISGFSHLLFSPPAWFSLPFAVVFFFVCARLPAVRLIGYRRLIGFFFFTFFLRSALPPTCGRVSHRSVSGFVHLRFRFHQPSIFFFQVSFLVFLFLVQLHIYFSSHRKLSFFRSLRIYFLLSHRQRGLHL